MTSEELFRATLELLIKAPLVASTTTTESPAVVVRLTPLSTMVVPLASLVVVMVGLPLENVVVATDVAVSLLALLRGTLFWTTVWFTGVFTPLVTVMSPLLVLAVVMSDKALAGKEVTVVVTPLIALTLVWSTLLRVPFVVEKTLPLASLKTWWLPG